VEAFRSTLDEVRDADMILHVADASEPEARRLAQALAVEDVLEEIGAGEIPRIAVFNKVDRLVPDERAALLARNPGAMLTSAVTGEGLDRLRDRLADLARGQLTALDVVIPYANGALLSDIYKQGHEVREDATDDGLHVTALLPEPAAARIRTALGLAGAA